jgi:hypothetical protein
MYCILRADLGLMVQMFVIDGTEPAAEDLAALETLKSTVKCFAGGGRDDCP